MKDGILERLYFKSLSNHLAIAVGSSCSDPSCSIPNLAEAIISAFQIDFSVDHRREYFQQWNELVKTAEKVVDRPTLVNFVNERIADALPKEMHRLVAQVHVSNFIDTTFDRSLYRALIDAGRTPIPHDWNKSCLQPASCKRLQDPPGAT